MGFEGAGKLLAEKRRVEASVAMNEIESVDAQEARLLHGLRRSRLQRKFVVNLNVDMHSEIAKKFPTSERIMW